MYKYFRELDNPKNFKTTLLAPYDDKKSNVTIDYIWPNAWYITPNGYLYNTGGKDGHKEGNLIYALDRCTSHLLGTNGNAITIERTNKYIKPSFEVPNINNFDKIKDILNRGYITEFELVKFSNLVTYCLPGIVSDETKFNGKQKNLITLIVGYLAAEMCFYNAFRKLNNSNCKEELLKELSNLTVNNYISDILVRFCGFHKIESILDKTITTTSLLKIDDFKEYLDKGWTLNVISSIIYDKEKDRLSEMNFNSAFIDRYLEKYKVEEKVKVFYKKYN